MTECGFIPPTPGYYPCRREEGHDGPCAHECDEFELTRIYGEAEARRMSQSKIVSTHGIGVKK